MQTELRLIQSQGTRGARRPHRVIYVCRTLNLSPNPAIDCAVMRETVSEKWCTALRTQRKDDLSYSRCSQNGTERKMSVVEMLVKITIDWRRALRNKAFSKWARVKYIHIRFAKNTANAQTTTCRVGISAHRHPTHWSLKTPTPQAFYQQTIETSIWDNHSPNLAHRAKCTQTKTNTSLGLRHKRGRPRLITCLLRVQHKGTQKRRKLIPGIVEFVFRHIRKVTFRRHASDDWQHDLRDTEAAVDAARQECAACSDVFGHCSAKDLRGQWQHAGLRRYAHDVAAKASQLFSAKLSTFQQQTGGKKAVTWKHACVLKRQTTVYVTLNMSGDKYNSALSGAKVGKGNTVMTSWRVSRRPDSS